MKTFPNVSFKKYSLHSFFQKEVYILVNIYIPNISWRDEKDRRGWKECLSRCHGLDTGSCHQLFRLWQTRGLSSWKSRQRQPSGLPELLESALPVTWRDLWANPSTLGFFHPWHVGLISGYLTSHVLAILLLVTCYLIWRVLGVCHVTRLQTWPQQKFVAFL